MKAAGRTLTVQELIDSINVHPSQPMSTIQVLVLVDGDPVPVVESDDGILITADELYDQSYTEAHELLQQIAEDPKVWTKKKIMDQLAGMGYGS
jgi:hypothetical protein